MRRLLAWSALLAGVAVTLHRLGGGLAPPPLTAPSELGEWLAARAPAEAVMALVRVMALVVTWYLLAATALALLARGSGRSGLLSLASALSVPLVRRMVGGAVGLSLAATTLTGPAATRAGAQPATATTVTTAVTMQRLPDDTAPEVPAPPAPPAAPAAPAAPVTGRTWEVQPGQHFWAVAEQVLTGAWSRAVSDGEVDRYWRVLIEANRSVLRDPGNPDLLYPGQVLTVPPPPARPN